MAVEFGLFKLVLDQILKRLPDTADKSRLRVQDELLRQTVDRNKELERVAELLGRVESQRDAIFAEAIRLRVRNAELEQENFRLRGQ